MPESGAKAVEKRYLLQFILITSMFLLWGLANNMTDTLLSAFKKIMSMSDTQTSLIQMAFYGAYFCVALPAALFIRKHSFKSGVVLGLCLYAAGAILFLPAAKAASYAFYLIAIYIMAAGCSVLETTSNPYVLSMGSPETATRRLNIAQAFNPIGSILGILISKYFILRDISLYSISGTYASLGVVLVFILVAMLFARMPQGRDEGRQDSLAATFRRLARNAKFRFGVIAEFFYVGAQIGVWSFTIRLVMKELAMSESQAAGVYLVSIIGFCASRFLYTAIMKYVRPRSLLLVGGCMSVVSSIAVVLLSGSGWPCVLCLILISAFMSLMFPTIYGLTLEDLPDAKIGASILIMSILGGALITPLQAMLSDAAGVNLSYLVPAGCFAVVSAFAIYLKLKDVR